MVTSRPSLLSFLIVACVAAVMTGFAAFSPNTLNMFLVSSSGEFAGGTSSPKVGDSICECMDATGTHKFDTSGGRNDCKNDAKGVCGGKCWRTVYVETSTTSENPSDTGTFKREDGTCMAKTLKSCSCSISLPAGYTGSCGNSVDCSAEDCKVTATGGKSYMVKGACQ